MPIPDLAFASARQLAQLVRQRKISAAELLEFYIARNKKYNAAINAVIATRLPAARKQAKALDALAGKRGAKSGGTVGPLHGVPMTVKESFDVAGLPSTWGLERLKANVPRRHALAVSRLEAAGAVIFGKTNVPVNLADWQSYNPIYGTTSNPWDTARTPGGSSGGSAAALAAGITALEIGSDIGASIRDPAHYCGVYGHKPSFEIVARNGHAQPGSYAPGDISVIGPLARSAFDLETELLAIAGPDAINGAGWKLSLPKAKKTRLRDYKVAVMLSDPTAEVDQEVQKQIATLARFLREQGAEVNMKARPIAPAAAHETFLMLLRSATSLQRSEAEFAALMAEREGMRGRDDYYARHVLGNTLPHREWLVWNNRRHQMRLQWAEFFGDYDLLLCPAAATTAFKHNHAGERWERMVEVNGKPQPTTTQMFWAGYSGMAYLPSTVAPVGLAKDGLPVGVQIVGPQYGDLTCLKFAQLLEREYHAFQAPPGFA
jgi:amidase